MPPKKNVRRQSKASLGKASELMGPPPTPLTAALANSSATSVDSKGEQATGEGPSAQKPFGQEIKALRECLIDAATTMAQLVNHHTDIHKIGVVRHAPYPPRGLREAWIRQSERYENIIDSIEIQVQRTLAAVEYQIELENEKLRIKEAEELQKKGMPVLAKGRKPSMSIDIPKFDESSIDPLTVHPDLTISSRSPEQADAVMQDGSTLVEEPMSGVEGTSEEAKAAGLAPSGAAVPKESALSRTSRSSISLTSLNRHGLKLDLSNLGIDGLTDSKSAITGVRPSALGAGAVSSIEAMASPVTLAPKSARPRTGYEGGEYMDLLQPLFDNPIDSIPLSTTVPGGPSIDVPATDINMDDLFGDNEMNLLASGEGNNSITGNPATTTIDSLFSPDDMHPVKTEEMPVSLPGGETMSQEDKLLEELGFVELSGNPMASTSNTEQQNFDNVIGSFDFSVAPDNSLSNDFNLMQQQLQQRQQFGLDLNLTSTTSGQAGQTDSNNALSDFGFDLFGSTDSNAAGGDLDFDIFNQPTTSDSKAG